MSAPAARPVRVLKFGGSSVASPAGVATIRRVVRERLQTGARPVVVVSAFAGVTDALARTGQRPDHWDRERVLENLRELHHGHIRRLAPHEAGELRCLVEARLAELDRLLRGVAMVGECSRRTLDGILSVGERLSAPVVAAALRGDGVPARARDARTLVVTDDRFGRAEPSLEATARAAREALSDPGEVPVVTGFIAADAEGRTTTLGRGGSDLTAAILGAVLDAEAVEIWSDVSGIMSADPREVPEAFTLEELSYDEILELSHWGAGVVHPPAVRPLRDREIRLEIRNTLAPEEPGSVVTAEGGSSSERPVRGVSSLDAASLVGVRGRALARSTVVARLFSTLAGASGGGELFVSQGSSERSVCLALRPGCTAPVVRALDEEFRLEREGKHLEPLEVEDDVAILAVVGEAMRRRPGIAGTVFGVLGREGINVRAIAQGSSELNITLAVAARDRGPALRAIHRAFFRDGPAVPRRAGGRDEKLDPPVHRT